MTRPLLLFIFMSNSDNVILVGAITQPYRAGRMEGLAAGGLGVLAFSFSLPATRLAEGGGLDLVVVGFGRAIVAGVLALGLLAMTRQKRPQGMDWLRIAVVAAGVVFGFPFFSALALEHLSAAHGAVIVGLLPAATAVAAVVRAGERPPLPFWLASGAGLVAVLAFAAFSGAGLPQPADLLVLVAVALCAFGYAEGGALARRLGGWQVICWALVMSLPVLVPLMAVHFWRSGMPQASATGWGGFLYLSFVSMFLGFFAWYRGLARGGVARIGQVQLAQPVLTLLWSALLLGERVSGGMVLAAMAVLVCVLLTQRTRAPFRAGKGGG